MFLIKTIKPKEAKETDFWTEDYVIDDQGTGLHMIKFKTTTKTGKVFFHRIPMCNILDIMNEDKPSTEE